MKSDKRKSYNATKAIVPKDVGAMYKMKEKIKALKVNLQLDHKTDGLDEILIISRSIKKDD